MHKSQADRITQIKTSHKREKWLRKFPKVKREMEYGMRESNQMEQYTSGGNSAITLMPRAATRPELS